MTTRYWTTLSVKVADCELVPETPWTVMVSLPTAAVGAAVKIRLTLRPELAGTCTGLEGAKPTVIPAGAVALRATASPLAWSACSIDKMTISV